MDDGTDAEPARKPPQAGRAGAGPFGPGAGRRVALLLAGAFLLGVAMVAAVLWVTEDLFGEMPISGAPLIAALLGGGGSMAIAAGLMLAIFHSNRSRWDDEIR
jgi:hypothetical protein